MPSTVSFKFEKSHQIIDHLQALGDFESKSEKLKIITKENNAVYIPETFKFFSPLLTNILEPQPSNQETILIVPDISSTAIFKVHELVSSGNVNDVIQSTNGDRYNNIIREIVDVAELFHIKINPTTISSDKKECVDSAAVTFQSEYSEIPAHVLNTDCAKSEVKVNELIKEEEDTFQFVDYKNESDIDSKELVFQKERLRIADVSSFEVSNYVGSSDHATHDYSFKCNNIPNSSFLGICSSKDSVTTVKRTEDVETNTQIEDMVATVQSVFSLDFKEAHEVPTAYYESDAISLNRFDLKLKRVTVRQLFKQIKHSCKSCQYQTTSRRKLKDHIETEHQDVIFFCSRCNFQTKSKIYLKRHVQAEHEDVRYSCESCSYQAKYKVNLRLHVQAKHGDVRYYCEKCSYQCKYKCLLKRHVRAEHEDVRYSCERCSYQAKQKLHLKHHVQAEHKDVRYFCERCSNQYKYKRDLEQHVRAKHGNVR